MHSPPQMDWRRCSKLTIATLAALMIVMPAAAAETPPVSMQIFGHGPVAVFESGLGGGHRSWEAVTRALAPCLTAVTYDRPGNGESPPPEKPDAPVLAATVADDLLARLRARGLPGPTF